MTTTKETTVGTIYAQLEALRGCQPDEVTRSAIQDVRDVMEQIRPTVERARQLIAEHEAQGQIVRATVISELDAADENEVDQGLWDLMQALSGARDLWESLRLLSDLCNPDLLTPDVIERIRARMDAERLAERSPRLLAYTLEGSTPWQRPAEDGEVCSCGQPASTVFVTTDHGEVPYCGVEHEVVGEEA